MAIGRDSANAPVPQCACEVCGATFSRRSGGNKLCSKECARVRRTRYKQERRRRAGIPQIGEIVPCRRCGEDIVKKRNQLYCMTCAIKRRAECGVANANRRRAYMREYARKRRLDPNIKPRKYIRPWKKRVTPHRKLHHRISTLVRSGLKNAKMGRTWRLLLAFSLEELYEHLERQFKPGMTWQNMGKWHIDHIVPRAAFSFTSADDPDFKACWALTNLRPLWSLENNSKRAERTHLL
jgi:hypothetical protein